MNNNKLVKLYVLTSYICTILNKVNLVNKMSVL